MSKCEMEDEIRDLLMSVLKQHYAGRTEVLENLMQIVKHYCDNEQTKTSYEKVLNTLYEIMNNDLPSNILLYFLTLVPLPRQYDYKSTIMELMKQTQNSLPENIKPVLVEYLNQNSSSNEPREIDVCEEKSKTFEAAPQSTDLGQIGAQCKTLTDLCAEYVVNNWHDLKELYDKKSKQIWDVVNSGVSQRRRIECHDVLRDVNRKIKWLRAIDSDNISREMIFEEYGNSDVFIKEKHLERHIFDDFALPDGLKGAIGALVNNL